MPARRTLRLILYVFLVTFAAARVTVFLIMDRWMPDLFLHVGGTHVHHLNYGIFLLSCVGGYVLVAPPKEPTRRICMVLYAIGLALTFDEFGMWLHLGGPYWQRASFDAIVLIAAVVALLAFAPDPRHWSRRRWIAAGFSCWCSPCLESHSPGRCAMRPKSCRGNCTLWKPSRRSEGANHCPQTVRFRNSCYFPTRSRNRRGGL